MRKNLREALNSITRPLDRVAARVVSAAGIVPLRPAVALPTAQAAPARMAARHCSVLVVPRGAAGGEHFRLR